MKNVQIILILFLTGLMLITSVAGARLLNEDLFISHVYIGDYGAIYPEDDYFFAVVSVHNMADRDLDDLRIEITIDELDFFARSQIFDLDDKDDRNDRKRTVLVYERIDSRFKPGMYYARISVENDDVRRVLYRPVWIAG